MPRRRAQRRSAAPAPWVAVVGARPNFVKLAPLVRAAAGRLLWIHTGQHESPALTRRLWRELELPPPTCVLPHVPPGTHRAEAMAVALVPQLRRLAPERVVVVGDVDSTVAGALAARRLGVPLAHVEAGLRSFERGLPEERNRRRVDRLSDLLHTSEPAASAQLLREGFQAGRVHEAGNVMADALRWALPRLPAASRRLPRGLTRGGFAVITLHRAANVDAPARLERWVERLLVLARAMPCVFPVHPRTAALLSSQARRAMQQAGLRALQPLGYFGMLALLRDAALVVTDSGGVPLEASLLGVPCVTLRAHYEHRLTLTHGTNVLAGSDPRRLLRAVECALARGPLRGPPPPAWDGRAATRCVARWRSLAQI